MNTLKDILTLTKARITLVVTLSLATGYILFDGQLDANLALLMTGLFFVASGSSVLNQIQEVAIDRRMPRTQSRPLPSGRITSRWAAGLALGLILFGFNLLANAERNAEWVLLLVFLALLWYNAIYTYLKRFTAFAVVPGALVGVFPPLVGWVGAGGLLGDSNILPFVFFLFLWQIPHFWLLLIRHGKEYEVAGLPSLTHLFSPRQIGRITAIWLLATALSGLLLALDTHMGLTWTLAFLIASLWLASKGIALLFAPFGEREVRFTFVQINAYALLLMILLMGSALT